MSAPSKCTCCACPVHSHSSDITQLEDTVASILGNDTHLDDQGEKLLMATAQTLRRSLKRVEQHVAYARQQLENRVSEQTSLHALLSHVATSLRPIRRLPRDVMRMIFRCDMDIIEAEEQKGYHSLDIDCGAHRLSRVCSSWQDVVQNSPELWTSVTLDYAWYPTTIPDRLVCGLSGILWRSFPLDLSVRIVNLPYRESSASDGLALALLHHGSRWKKLQWAGESEPMAFKRLVPLFTTYTAIKNLTFENSFGEILGDLMLPAVTRLSLAGYDQLTSRNINRSQIVSYAAGPYRGEIAAILAQMQHLENAVITFAWRIETNVVAEAHITLSHLISLELRGSVGQASYSPGQLLCCLTAPSLKTLRCFLAHEGVAQDLASFIQRAPSITHLAIERANNLTYDLIDVFQAASKVKSLESISDKDQQGAISWTSLSTSPPLLPSLRELKLNHHVSNDLLDTLETRFAMESAQVARLKCLRVRISSPHLADRQLRIERLVEQYGLYYEEFRTRG